MTLARPFRALALASLLAIAAPAAAQDVTIGFSPRTGDVWVDTWLVDINRYGAAYREPFVDELVRFHRAPRELVVDLLGRPGWTPGDVYFACSLAAAIGRPCRYVVDEYERDRGAGWGALAQRLGIKPGSAEFHRLKRGFVPTYDRWSRPIQLDDELDRAFPGRARAPGARAPKDAPRPDAPAREARPGRVGSGPGPDAGKGPGARASEARGDDRAPKDSRGGPQGRGKAPKGEPGKGSKGGNGKGKG